MFISSEVLPIILAEARENGPPRTIAFCGTGFRVADDVLVTCWHCVSAPEPDNGGFAVGVRLPDGTHRAHPLLDVAQDANGTDLASARIFSERETALPPHQLGVATPALDVGTGTDVWTYGYPLTTPAPDRGDGAFTLNPRLLRGYITREFDYDHPTFGSVPSYELDMRTPEGLSGAPLVQRPGSTVIGVIFGRHDVELVEEFAAVDPETGVRTPEIARIFSFGLACDKATLGAVRGPATRGLPLVEYIDSTV